MCVSLYILDRLSKTALYSSSCRSVNRYPATGREMIIGMEPFARADRVLSCTFNLNAYFFTPHCASFEFRSIVMTLGPSVIGGCAGGEAVL
jgi:hypothetical protein